MFGLALPSGVACDKPPSLANIPQPALAQTLDAQSEANGLISNWQGLREGERAVLVPRLVAFIGKYPDQPWARMARLYLAWIRLRQGRWDESEQLADVAGRGSPGVIADRATLVKAAVLNRRQRPEQALALLDNLSGSLIDADDRSHWARESIEAALRLKHFGQALDFMDRWMVEVGDEDARDVEYEVRGFLSRVPAFELDRGLPRLIEATKTPTTSVLRARGRLQMVDMVREHLAKDALARNDTFLARRLIASAPRTFLREPTGERLSRLALSRRILAARLGRVIGVLLELDSARIRRQESEILAGIIRTLRDLSGVSSIRVKTRTIEGGANQEIAASLDELAAEGAAIVVTGFSRATSEAGITWATRTQASLLLASAWGSKALASNVFEMGIDHEQFRQDFLTQVEGSEPRSVLDATHPLCLGGVFEPSIVPWGNEPPPELLVIDDADCVAGLVPLLARQSKRSVTLWLGPEATSTDFRSDSNGLVHLVTVRRSEKGEPDTKGVLEWQSDLGRPPTWNEALGHDAAMLAAEAMKRLPTEEVTEGLQQAKLRELVAQELSTAHTQLWTAEGDGFDGAHRLRRTWSFTRAPDVGTTPRRAVP